MNTPRSRNWGGGRSVTVNRPASAGALATFSGALITAQAPTGCSQPIAIALGEPRGVDAAGAEAGGFEGRLRALISATVEQSTINFRCDWRGYLLVVAYRFSINWEWTRVPVGAAAITFSAQWGPGDGDGGRAPTLFDPFTVAGGLIPGDTEDFLVPNLSNTVELAADEPNASGEIEFLTPAGTTLAIKPVSQGGDPVSVPAGSRTARYRNSGATNITDNSGIIWRLSV